ncbi:ribulokinase [Rhodohalobacter sp. 8-1]|uniref:ribulokinase n=1 Tax=Rhodohalobacter sp. 8-1 TaxID=3131972 RepID=UPI0030ED115A
MVKEAADLVIGIDFGTDSVRAILIDINGNVRGVSTSEYPRWKQGLYCNPSQNQFRQHPLDYLESMETAVSEIVSDLSVEEKSLVKGMSIDTTGSTPVAVTQKGEPLALTEGFQENPNAMFILWKDHTAIEEAGEINALASAWPETNYTKYVGGIYSSEWFWAKLLHISRMDENVRDAAYSWAEHCDWITFELTGGTDVASMKRSRCAAGHKAMWHEEFDGLPSEEFLSSLDPLLSGLRERLYRTTETSDQAAGSLSSKWAEKWSLNTDITIGVGAFDAHMGAVGGEIKPYYLSRVMGTSTCDMLVVPHNDIDGKLIRGICGQVDGSVIPGLMGLEAGQSAFGDVYAWFKDILQWPVKHGLEDIDFLNSSEKKRLQTHLDNHTIQILSDAASKLEPSPDDEIALDWLNGRRTPDADQHLKAAFEGLNLATDAPHMFKALVEATCFGAKAIVERFESEGIEIDGVIGLGGVAKKSPYVMQTLANVLDMPIKIVRSDETCAMGAAMFAATAAGLFPTVEKAMTSMGDGFEKTYHPDKQKTDIYKELYSRYQQFGEVIEARAHIENDETKAQL